MNLNFSSILYLLFILLRLIKLHKADNDDNVCKYDSIELSFKCENFVGELNEIEIPQNLKVSLNIFSSRSTV